MAVTLTGAGGLFTILGKVFGTLAQLNTSRGTDVQAKHLAVHTALETLADNIAFASLGEDAALETSFEGWRDNNSYGQSLVYLSSQLLVEMVNADTPLAALNVREAMLELVYQMEGSGGEANPDDDVDGSTAAVTVAATAGNVTDAQLIATVVNGDGRNAEHSLAEVIDVDSTGSGGNLRIRGELAASNRLVAAWPEGSGASRTIQPLQASAGMLTNGGMDAETDRDNAPDDWEVAVGTIGTTILMSNYEVQTVILSGTPTGGTYTLTFTSVDSDVQTTEPLAYNASGSTVQSALRKLKGLEALTIVTTGTSPDFTHTITFTKVFPPGDMAILASTSGLTGGSPNIAHAQVTAGTAHVVRDKAVIFDANGSELTQLRQRIDGSLSPRSVYAFGCWMKVDVYPAAGTLVIDLVDGAGSAITDAQGGANLITIDPQSGGDLSTSAFSHVSGWFRTPAVLPDIVYLRIRISVAVSNTSSIYIDEVTLQPGISLYQGGPIVAAFAGQTSVAPDDTFTITVTNDRAGGIQEWFLRVFGQADLLLPSDSGGSETIADTLIS